MVKKQYKKGDKATVVAVPAGKNGAGHGLPIGTEIIVEGNAGGSSLHGFTYYVYKVEGGSPGNGPSIFEYELTPSLREDMIDNLEKAIVDAKAEVGSMEDRLDYLINYESDEDYIAEKIADILASGGNKDSIKKILKEAKSLGISLL